jgi:hypothetical protein
VAVSARFFHSAARFRQRRAISTRSNISQSAPAGEISLTRVEEVQSPKYGVENK